MISSGLPVGVKPAGKKREEKPTFEKPIWVSRFSNETKNGDIANNVTTNTTITDKTRFNIHKLVKKDCNIESLNLVSFRTEVSTNDLEIFCEPEM